MAAKKKPAAKKKLPAERKKKLQARKGKLEQRDVELGREIGAAKRAAKRVKGKDAKEQAADRVDALVGERAKVRAQIEDVKADLGDVNADLRRQKRRAERRRQKRAERSQYWASENFRFDEFNCHEGGPVPEYMYPHLRELCEKVLEPMRAEFGPAHVNSGHRWRFYNIKIGGATASYHEYEMRKSQPAADVTFARGTPAEWAAFARRLGVGGVGQYSSFVHVDTGPRRDWYG